MSTSIGSKEWLHLYSLGSNFLKCLSLRILCIILSCLKGELQIQTWPISRIRNACWWFWHNPNVSGTNTCIQKAGTLSCLLSLLIYCYIYFFLLIKHFNDFKDLTYNSLFLWFQIIRAILENPKDKTNVHLIYASVTLDDMLLKVICLLQLFFSWDELETLVQSSKQVQWYTSTKHLK